MLAAMHALMGLQVYRQTVGVEPAVVAPGASHAYMCCSAETSCGMTCVCGDAGCRDGNGGRGRSRAGGQPAAIAAARAAAGRTCQPERAGRGRHACAAVA